MEVEICDQVMVIGGVHCLAGKSATSALAATREGFCWQSCVQLYLLIAVKRPSSYHMLCL